MTPPGLYAAKRLSPRVAIADDGTLVATLAKVMQGWEVVDAGGGPGAAAPTIRVRRTEGGWTFLDAAGAAEVTFEDPVAAACRVIADLYKAQTLIDREGLCLHAAGVRIGGGVVLLTGQYRAGKSLLTAACAAAGLQVFSDDIVPLGPAARLARAPGLAIRLRLPLPETVSPETRAFLARHEVAAGPRYVYIRPPQDRLAGQGAEAPVRAIVSLRRAEGEAARLFSLDTGEALSEIIRRNFAREGPAGGILEAFDRLVDEVPGYRLVYDRAEEAAALLADAFAGGAPAVEAAAEAPREAVPEPAAGKARRPRKALPETALISRETGTRVREREGQAFLTDADETVIFNLNLTGAAVWRLLERPAAFGDLLDLFAEAFPERGRSALAGDLSHLLRALAANGFVRIEGPEGGGAPPRA